MDNLNVLKGAGGGGGKKQKPPVEAKNTLQATNKAKLLDLIQYGNSLGLAEGLKSVYLGGTPLQNDDDTLNFEGIRVQFREGLPDQEIIEGFRSIENIVDVSTEVKNGAPLVRSLTNANADAAIVTIRLGALYKQDSKGNTNPHEVSIAIDWRVDQGPWQTGVSDSIRGKTMSAYPRSYRIDFRGARGAIDLRVRRLSADDADSKSQSATTWTMFNEVIDRKFSYPDMTLVGIEIDAQEFGNAVPERTYDMFLSIVKVPSNYDPYTRTYTGLWDGSFKSEWTDNPAWVFYDVATDPVFGADIPYVDKFALYTISQYCDELVPDGYGGMEPRFTFNSILSGEEDAITALSNIASVFRGMVYWGSNTVTAVADMPEDPSLLVTPANSDGNFSYVETAENQRHSVAVVMFNDPEQGYELTPVIHEDPDSIRQFGWREVRVTAVGCTSRGQALRLAKWILYSEREETETVSYTASIDHALMRPGMVIQIADPNRAGARLGGRVMQTGLTTLTLDRVPEDLTGDAWFFSVQMPDGTIARRKIQEFLPDNQILLDSALPDVPVTGAVWVISALDLKLPEFRVTSVEEDGILYSITATQYDVNKYDIVEQGLKIERTPDSLIPRGPIAVPGAITVAVETYLAGGTDHQKLVVSWEPSTDPRVTFYLLEAQGPGEVTWRTAHNGAGTLHEELDAEPGQWMFRVRAENGLGAASQWVAHTAAVAGLLEPAPPTSVDVEVGTFTVSLRPRSPNINAMYEFWRSTAPLSESLVENNAVFLTVSSDLVDVNLTPDTQYYYWVRGHNAYGVSNWFPVQAHTEERIDEILDLLDGQIKEHHLYDQLGEKIDLITGDGPGSVNERIEGVAVELGHIAGDVAGLQDSVAELNSDLQSSVGDLNDAISDAENRLSAEIGTVSAHTDSLDQSVADLQSDVSGLGDDLQSSVSNLNDAIGDVDSRLTGRIENVASDISGLGNSISDLYEQVGGLDDDLQLSVSDLNSQLAQLETQIADITGAGEWLPGQPYLAGSLVRFDGALYRAEQDVPSGTPVSDAAYWRKVGDYASIGEAVAALTIQVTDMQVAVDEITGTQSSIIETTNALIASSRGNRADGEKADALRGWQTQASITQRDRVEASDKAALAERLLVIDAQIGDASAQLSTLQQAFADETTATASALASLSSSIGSTAADLQQEIQTRATETSALASDIQALQVALEDVATVEAFQGLVAEVEQLGEDISAVGLSVTTLAARIGDAESAIEDKADAAALQALNIEVLQIGEDLSSAAQSIVSLGATLTTVSGAADAAADLAAQADGKADEALQEVATKADASAVQGLTAEVQQIGEDVAANSGLITELGSSVTAAQQTADDALAGLTDKADASALQALTTEVDQIGEDLSAASQSITDLDASLQSVSSTAQGAADLAEQADGKADDALLGLIDKADASAVQALTVEVSQIGEDLSAASQSITDLSSSLSAVSDVADGAAELADQADGKADEALEGLSTKADATALQSLSTDVQQIGEDVAANSGAITALDSRVESAETGIAGNADAVEALTTEVSEIDGRVTAAAEQASRLSAELRPSRADGDKADSLRGWMSQASIVESSRVSASEREVLAQRLFSAEVQLGEASAQLSVLETAFVDESESTASQLTALASELGTTASGLQQEIQTRATETAALASDVQSMQVALEGVATSEALQALTVEVEQLGNDITSVAQSVTSLTSRIEETETSLGAVSTAVDGLQTSVTEIEGELSAQASDITALGVSIGEVGDLAGQADGKADEALQGLGDKADATAVQGLATEVNQIGEDLSAASQSITDLGSSLSLVSDVADGAARAADDALAGLATKADASAVQALTTEVEQIGEDVTANAGAITQLGSRLEAAESGIAGNADAVESLTTDVELIDGKVTAAAEQASRLSVALRPNRADGEKADSLRGWQSQASITESSRVSASEREVLAQRLFSAEVQLGEASAQISVLETAFADGSESTASQLTALASELGITSAGLQGEIQTRVTENAALSQSVQSLQAAIEDVEESTASSAALAALRAEVEDLEGVVAASSQDIVSLSSAINTAADAAQAAQDSADEALQGLGSKADSSALQALGTTVTQQGADLSSQGQALTSLSGRVDGAEGDIAGNADAIQSMGQEVQQLDGRITAGADLTNRLAASVRPERADGDKADALRGYLNQAQYVEAVRVQATETESSVERDQLLQAQVANTNAALLVEQQVRSSEIASLAEQTLSMRAQIDSDIAAIQDILTVEVGPNGSLAQQINTVAATAAQGVDKANTAQSAAQDASDLAGGKGRVFFQSAAPATSERLPQNLWIDTTGGANTPKRWSGSAWVAVTDKVATDAASAAAAALSAVNTLDARVTTEVNAIVGPNGVLAQQINTVQTQLGQQIAAVQQIAESGGGANDRLEAMYSLRLDVNGYVSGFGLANDGVQSTFAIRADRFYIARPGVADSEVIPFIVEAGQVYMRSAMIQDASISSAKIANASITSAKIADSIQSDDFVANEKGWRINKNGTFELNGSVDGEGRIRITNRAIIVYDGEDRKRVQMGDLTA